MTKAGRKELSLARKLTIYIFLRAHAVDGKIPRGVISDAADQLKCHRNVISKILRATKGITEAEDLLEVLKPKTSTRGVKGYSGDALRVAIKNVPMNRRRTYRVLARASGISKSSLHRAVKCGKLWVHSSAVKPFLTERNKVDRVRFSLKFVRREAPDLPFSEMFDTVHIDEKWFYLVEVGKSYILLPDEEPPHRSVKSKRFITKVMFLAAVARPRWDHTRGTWFDGKLGIWPFVQWVEAARNSRNRPAGTLELKSCNVDREVYREFLVQKVFPSIRDKFPTEWKEHKIHVQQDNARPHVSHNDEEVVAAGATDGWDIVLRNQPPNSPDLNVLDLGFFNAIQSLQQEACATTVAELVDTVHEAFDMLSSTKLTDTFITLQAVMREIMRHKGGNNYKLPHLKKQTMRRKGQEIVWVHCDEDTLAIADGVLED